MKNRFLQWWQSVRSSYWFIPTLMAIFAIILSVVMINIDTIVKRDVLLEFRWLYVSEAEGGRAVLSTIAGSMITVAGVVFSITMVALTLASQQFGPRLLGNFMRDQGNQIVLGIFIATFVYCLLVLRTITSLEANAFVPQLSVLVGVLLALISIGVLIYFIHHISASIRVSNLIDQTSEELLSAIDRLFPEKLGDTVDPYKEQRIKDSIPKDFEQNLRDIYAPGTDYLQAIEYDGLMRHAVEYDLLIRVTQHTGDFVIEGSVIAEVWHRDSVDDELAKAIQRDFLFSAQRTATQDVVFLFDKLVEIAVRALSPGINDPFTAILCIDRLTEALRKITTTNSPSVYHFDDSDVLRVIAETVDLGELIHHIITPIRNYGIRDLSIVLRLLNMIKIVASRTHHPEAKVALHQQAIQLKQGAVKSFVMEWDIAQVLNQYNQMSIDLDWLNETT